MTRHYLLCSMFVALGCGESTSTAPTQINLDRPIDVAFTCFGGLRVPDGPGKTKIIQTATTPASCATRSEFRATDPMGALESEHRPPGQEDGEGVDQKVGTQSWVAFILQQGPGTVAFANYATVPAFQGSQISIVDADPLTPGKNAISVGEDPIAIATDKSGCHEIIANAGTCDLSDLDVPSAVNDEPSVRRFEVRNGAGQRIGARPAAMISEPATTVVGFECPKDDTGAAVANGLVYIAYPGCHLVAAVDTATGVIQKGIQYDAAGVPSIVDGANLTCPDECDGTLPTTGTRPVAIDLQEDLRIGNRRMVIGSDNSPALTIVELDPVTTLPLSLSQVALQNTTGNLGVTDVAISPQIGMGGFDATVNDDIAGGGQSQFVYAVATDNTVRVADILLLGRECDTQVDPRFLRSVVSVKTLSCLVVGDPATPPRRAGARGPGITLTGDAVPLSVKISRSDALDPSLNQDSINSTLKLIGYFAIVTATNGESFVVNVDDDSQADTFRQSDPLPTAVPLVIAHQLHDFVQHRDETLADGSEDHCKKLNPVIGNNIPIGGPRASNPQRAASPLSIAAEKVTELPNLRQFRCTGEDITTASKEIAVPETSFVAPRDVRDLVYPDWRALASDETWTITYEGPLSTSNQANDADGPQIREAQMRVDGLGIHILDFARPFCGAGVEPFDIFQMRGCDPAQGNDQCPKGYRCFVHPESDIAGIGECMLETEAERLANACRAFLTSQRRYTIKQARAGELLLVPRRVELRTSPLDGCTDDVQCKTLADYAAKAPSSNPPVSDVTPPDARTWTCTADPDRAPVTTGKRCELRCDADADCTTGTICQGGGAGAKSGFCMEGVMPPQSCVNAPQRFELRAGQAFAVVGTQTGFVHPIIADANGACVKDPTASRLQIGRIPLTAPACDPTADPATGKRADGTFDPNPCSLTTTTTDVMPNYVDAANGNCAINQDPEPGLLVDREAPAIRFRGPGMTLTMMDPFYPGDSKCILDRGGGLGRIPLVFRDYQLAFRQNAGFSALRLGPALGMAIAYPVRVVRGPLETLWVVDQGDVLSTSIGQASTRGQVLRVPLQGILGTATIQ